VLGVLVGTDTVTAQGHSPRTGHARNGDFYLAKNGDLHLATSEDFFMATDNARPAQGGARSSDSGHRLANVRALDAACGASGALEERGAVVVVVDERH
jgi:hypothetical protein